MSCCFIEITTRNIKNVKKQGIGLTVILSGELHMLFASVFFDSVIALDVSEP